MAKLKKKTGALKKEHIGGISPVRISKIVEEFVGGFQLLDKYDNTVTFFGSARTKPSELYYKEAYDLAYKLSKHGYTIVTGGGGGVMEAANKGAFNAGGNSIGINIELVATEAKNKYLTDSLSFHYFFSRKVMLTFASQAYIFLPGGFGTLDELFEILTLVQTRKIKKIPIILLHKDYWEPLLVFFEKTLYKEKETISKTDMNIYTLVDSVDEALKTLKKLQGK